MATTVSKLCVSKESICSSDSILRGHLRVLDRDHLGHKKGTVLLINPLTQEAIPCLVDRLNVEVNKKKVEIKKWNYIYDEVNGCQYLEFSLDDVFIKNAELSAIRSGILNDRNIIQAAIEADTLYYTPSISINQVPKSNVNVAGIVVAVSPLYTPLNSEARFFVEIADGSESAAITLYFPGDKSIHYQLCFRIGRYYTFTDLSPVTISYGRHTRDVLLFQPTSTLQFITTVIYQELNILQHPPSIENAHKITVSEIPDTRSTYVGYITRIIDSILGIYEIDNTLILSAFHHFVSAQPFRVNTKIQITHFHKTFIYTDNPNYKSVLLNDLWKVNEGQVDNTPHIALVACNRTRIEILEFPQSCDIAVNDLPGLNDTREALAMYMITHHSTFSQFMRLLEIYAILVVRFGLTSLSKKQFKNVVENISKHIFKATNTPPTRGHGHLGNDFFQHDKACSAIGSTCTVNDRGFLSVYLDSYPCIRQCVDYFDEHKKDYEKDLAGANFAFDVHAVKVQSTSFDPTMGFYILGVISLSADNRMVLKDETSSVFISVGSKNDVQIGDMYLLRRGQYFCEDLSYRKDLTTCNLSSTYLACHGHDLLKVFSKPSDSPNLTFQRRHGLDHDKLGFFSIGSSIERLFVDTNLHQYVVCHVLKKFPIATSISKIGVYTLECRIVVRLYNVKTMNNENAIEMDPNKLYDLVLNTRNGSLGHYYQLNVDDWCVIYGLNEKNTKLQSRESNVFTMDASHKIYPIVYSKEPIQDAIVLMPALTNQRPVKTELPRPVLKISEINDPNRPRVMGNSSEYINVRGVVILKKFDQRSGLSIYDTKAHDFYVKHGLGTGVPYRRLQIQLRELDSLQMISISMDLTNVHYPLGLVHGATVVIRNLMRKVKGSNAVYYNAGSETLIEIESVTTTRQVYVLQNNETETNSISWIMQTQLDETDIQDKLLRINCNVSAVMTLQLKWKCSNCGFTIKNSECYAMCENASRVFNASAYIEISDGTASANANVDGERLVFRLLRLSDVQIVALKKFVASEEVDYSIWNPSSLYDVNNDTMKKMCGLTVDDLLTRARAVPRIRMFGKAQSTSRKRKRQDFQQEEDLQMATIIRPITISDNGGLLRSYEFIKPKISIQEIEACDPVTFAYSLLNKM